MYLITVARAAEEGVLGPVPVTVVAGSLHVSVAAANEMIRKLASRGLVEYQPYRGVELTTAGRRVADRVLRTRRIWSSFLAGHLEFTPSEADALACHLEHVTPPDAADRLAAWLGDPEVGPLGRPIPPPTLLVQRSDRLPLADVETGIAFEVVSIAADRPTAAFLAAEGVCVGGRLRVAGRGETGLLVDTGEGRVHLDHATAAGVGVRAVRDGS